MRLITINRFTALIKIEISAETKTPTSWMPLRSAKTYQKLFRSELSL